VSDEKPKDVPVELWDAARRMMDAHNLHMLAMVAENRDRPGYVAIRLEDGRSPDGVLYDTRKDAARHQSDPKNFYVKVGKMSMSSREAVAVLKFARQALAAGVVFAEEEPILPQLSELAPRGNFPRISLAKWGRNGDGKDF
jgi:hypothetical protein